MAKLSDLVAQATRTPYPLELDDGTVIEVQQPTIEQFREASGRDIGAFLADLGVSEDDAALVRTQLAGAPYGAETTVIIAIAKYFRLGN